MTTRQPCVLGPHLQTLPQLGLQPSHGPQTAHWQTLRTSRRSTCLTCPAHGRHPRGPSAPGFLPNLGFTSYRFYAWYLTATQPTDSKQQSLCDHQGGEETCPCTCLCTHMYVCMNRLYGSHVDARRCLGGHFTLNLGKGLKTPKLEV